jgi:hypothetical protein
MNTPQGPAYGASAAKFNLWRKQTGVFRTSPLTNTTAHIPFSAKAAVTSSIPFESPKSYFRLLVPASSKDESSRRTKIDPAEAIPPF